ncbi:sigma-70 family RNA polymerase sigma factor [Lapillicoccus jejuensis]|uniref:sigma-70 family RNA polymerase sigma factor n=1 Tax=Lapillicoccus jejuensis TaxID=402171 RepID=UPI001FECE5A5|nr:sigma-70 family RNA polymerase sigma factor [Lapillicoccus jejuensis]
MTTTPAYDAAAPPDDRVDDRDEIVRLLATLPEQQRKVVVLRYYADLSEQQVADALGVSVGTVKSTASRALATLRERHPSPRSTR